MGRGIAVVYLSARPASTHPHVCVRTGGTRLRPPSQTLRCAQVTTAASHLAAEFAGPVHAALQRYWGFATLRPLQAEAIQAGLAQRDSLVVLPTGGGKSLCYQVPPLVAGRVDVVVSPLIALMKDQVDGLQAAGYPAAALHSNLSRAESSDVERQALAGQYRLLFVAPEKILNSYTLGLLRRLNVRAFAIDEAHCISHWGHDFRPHYRQLAQLREYFPEASLHAYTATATQRVRDDIVQQLCLRDASVLVGTFDRPNLIYRILPKADAFLQTLQVLRRHEHQAAIVYCLSRRDSEDMAEYLRSQRIRAAHYHAGMEADARRRTQDDFAAEKIDVVAATVAFGMGIDRSDVRCVIHAALPKSLEHYQQETGRAGRDGLEAECVLFYSYGDVARWESLIAKSAANSETPEAVTRAATQLLREIQRLCTACDCRHASISAYFGQAYPKTDCGACDVCLGEVEGISDATVTAQKILSCVARCGQRFGAGHIVDVLTGAKAGRIFELGHHELSTYALLKEVDKKTLQGLIYQLVDLGVLERTTDEYPTLKLNAASWEVMRGQRTVRLRQAAQRVKKTKVEAESWEGVDRGLFDALRALRQELALAQGVPPYVILHDTALRALARLRPTSVEALAYVPGFGAKKIERLGQQVVQCIVAHCREHGVGTDVHELAEVPPEAPRPAKRLRPDRNAALRRAMDLFAQGRSVAAVAEEIGRAESTTWQYLEKYVAEARPADVSAWVDAATYKRVAAALRSAEDRRLRPIFDALEGSVPFPLIRIVATQIDATFDA